MGSTTASSAPPVTVSVPSPGISLSQVPQLRGALSSGEIWWRDQSAWLEAQGYQLRPRYRPNWRPSWEGDKRRRFWQCEDGLPLMYSQFLDAVRLEDHSMVGLKRVSLTNSAHEVEMHQTLSSLPQTSDNHCIAVSQTLRLPDGDTVILVMPFLRAFDSPPFDSIGEVLECCRQLFEGLSFMHSHYIAHRDCHAGNFMMDPRPMYPDMFHPFSPDMNVGLSKKAKHFTRTERPVKYYFIDFGISGYYPSNETPPSAMVPIHVGGDRTVPEFQCLAQIHDPFPTDIYYVGNLVRETFLQKYRGLERLSPLIEDMVQDDPTKRPTAVEVGKRFDALKNDKTFSAREQRKRLKSMHEVLGVLKDIRRTWRRLRSLVIITPQSLFKSASSRK